MVEDTQTLLELPEGRVVAVAVLKAEQVVPAAEHQDKEPVEEVLLAQGQTLIQLVLEVAEQVLLANLLLQKVFEVAKVVQGSPVP
jgi:hypothetical protein